MKSKLLLALCLCVLVMQSHAQWINSLTVVPANPTTNDSVSIILNADFSSGPCNDATHGFFQNGFTFSAFAMHCTGMLTVICTDEDTFNLGQLATGNYTFTVQVDQGQGPSPCTPGIIAGPNATANFTVSTSSSVYNPEISNEFFLTPNPGSGFIKLKSNSTKFLNDKDVVKFYSEEGKLLLKLSAASLKNGVYLPFAKGIYFAEIKAGTAVINQKIILGD